MRSPYYGIIVSPESPSWRAGGHRGGAHGLARNETDGIAGHSLHQWDCLGIRGPEHHVMALRDDCVTGAVATPDHHVPAWLAVRPPSAPLLAEGGPLPSAPLFNRRR